MQRDPAGYVDGPNLYVARLVNPITYNDALGLYGYRPELISSTPKRKDVKKDGGNLDGFLWNNPAWDVSINWKATDTKLNAHTSTRLQGGHHLFAASVAEADIRCDSKGMIHIKWASKGGLDADFPNPPRIIAPSKPKVYDVDAAAHASMWVRDTGISQAASVSIDASGNVALDAKIDVVTLFSLLNTARGGLKGQRQPPSFPLPSYWVSVAGDKDGFFEHLNFTWTCVCEEE